jgi:alpha-galactosidase
MVNLFKYISCTITCILLLQGCTQSNDKQVDVTLFTTNNSIESKVEIINEGIGKKYVHISLKNNGDKIDLLDSIRVVISPPKNVQESSKTMFGGSDMGRTPISQSVVSDGKGESDTFQMIELSKNSFSLTGVLTWNTFLPYIHYDSKKGIVVTADGEGKPINPGETIEFEEIILDAGDSWQDLMFAYGEEIAKEHAIEPKDPLQLKGWSTWDYYGRVYDTKDIIKNIDQLVLDEKSANIIQIDGGWWTARGDYLSVRDNLEGGLKAIATYAKSKGFRAGIHLDGFRADKNSEVYREHPNWFLKDQDGETIVEPIDKVDTFMRYIYFDYSNPAVCEYMKNVLQTIRTDWGYSYFKIDFMRYGLLQTIMDVHGRDGKKGTKLVTKVVAFNNDMTSVERTRAGLKAMREGIDDAFFLACSSIFGPTLGIVDGLRTGGDISPRFEFYKTRVLQNGGNFYLNSVVTQNDADYLVLRNKNDEEPERAWGKHKFGGNTTYDEAKMWSDYVALYGGIKINSDNLLTLRDERKELIDNAFNYKTATRFIPIDLWNHARNENDAFNIMLAENEDGVFLSLFNWDETDKQFILDGIGKAAITTVDKKINYELKDGKLKINLKTHSSIIFKVDGANFDSLRKTIQNLSI